MYEIARRSLIQFVVGAILMLIGQIAFVSGMSPNGPVLPHFAINLFPVGYIVNVLAIVNAIRLRVSERNFKCGWTNWTIAAAIPGIAPLALLFYLPFLPRHTQYLKTLK